MLPKFKTSTTPQFQTLNDSGTRDLSRSGFTDDSKSIASEHRDDSSCDIFSAEGKQFSVSSADAEAREAFGKEMVHPGSPVDCFGFPETEALPHNLVNAKSAGAQQSRKDTAPETLHIRSASEEFRNRQWASLPPPPPPPPRAKMNTSASIAPQEKETGAADDIKDSILALAKHVAMSEAFQPTEWPETSVPPPDPSKETSPTITSPPTVAKSFANMFDQQALSETEIMTSFENTFSPVGTPPDTSFDKDDASSFMESVVSVTMDAFGFPLVEPTTPAITPAKSIGTKSTPKSVNNNKSNPRTPATSTTNSKSITPKTPATNKRNPRTPATSTPNIKSITPKTPATNKSMRAVPVCARDSPAKAMNRIKSAPALNRLIANAHMQAHYKEDTAFQFQADFSIPDAQPNASESTALSEANEEPQEKVDELTTDEAAPLSIRDLVAKESKVGEIVPEATPKTIRNLVATNKSHEIMPQATPKSIENLAAQHEIMPQATPKSIENLGATQHKIDKAKAPATNDNVDQLLVGSIDGPNKSCEDRDAILAVTSTELTNPIMNVSAFSPSFTGHEAPSTKLGGSFDANESSIALLDSSVEIPMKVSPRRKRLPSSKLRCTDDILYCNINLKEVEKTMWSFMDAFDERAGKCGYVVGCTDRVPKVVRTDVNDTFSLLEDEFLVNKAAEHSVSMLDSLIIDD